MKERKEKNRLFARSANREATGTDRLFARAGSEDKGARGLSCKKQISAQAVAANQIASIANTYTLF